MLFFYLSGALPLTFQNPVTETERSFDQVTALLKRFPGDIFFEDQGLAIAVQGHVDYEPYEFALLARRGLWDERKLVERFDKKYFGLVVLNTNLLHPQMKRTARFNYAVAQAIRRNYRFAAVYRGYFLLTPIEEKTG